MIFSYFAFLKINKIPKKNWSSDRPLNFKPKISTIIYLFIGLFFISFGEGLLIISSSGNSPWRVLSEGVSESTNLSTGVADLIISLLVLLIWFFLKQKPGIGTLMNLIIVALVIDLTSIMFVTPSSIYWQYILGIVSILFIGLGTSIYLTANLGPGPRDGLMTGFMSVTKLPVFVIRTTIEIIVVITGWKLGGTLGISTLIFALLIGPVISLSLYLIHKFY